MSASMVSFALVEGDMAEDEAMGSDEAIESDKAIESDEGLELAGFSLERPGSIDSPGLESGP